MEDGLLHCSHDRQFHIITADEYCETNPSLIIVSKPDSLLHNNEQENKEESHNSN